MNKYKCNLCNIFFSNIEEIKTHQNSKKHSARKELKYMELRFEKKMNEADIELTLKQLEEISII